MLSHVYSTFSTACCWRTAHLKMFDVAADAPCSRRSSHTVCRPHGRCGMSASFTSAAAGKRMDLRFGGFAESDLSRGKVYLQHPVCIVGHQYHATYKAGPVSLYACSLISGAMRKSGHRNGRST